MTTPNTLPANGGVSDAYRLLLDASRLIRDVMREVGGVVTTCVPIPSSEEPWPSVASTKEGMETLRRFYDKLPGRLSELDAALKELAPLVNVQSRQPSAQGGERDTAWTMAIAEALGLQSGFDVPLVPDKDRFSDLFRQVRERTTHGITVATVAAEGAEPTADAVRDVSNALRSNHPLAPGKCSHGLGMNQHCSACLASSASRGK